MSTIAEVYGNGGGFPGWDSTTTMYCGLECELEGVRHPKPYGSFNCIQDGSLRNHGYEFVSSPLSSATALKAFAELHEHLTFYDKEDPFSIRTSTHVHVNVLGMEMKQVRNFVLLYALFEEFFFTLVKPARRDNIHCVPLTETYLPSIYKKDLKHYVSAWHKYTALNLKRIPDLGTIEFRHMHGTGDVEEMRAWLHVLENLWKLAQRVDINKETLCNKEEIKRWFELLFFPSDRVMMLKPTLFDLIRNSLIDVKFSV